VPVLHINLLASYLFKEISRAINLTWIAVLTTLTFIVAGERVLAKRMFRHFSPEVGYELHLNMFYAKKEQFDLFRFSNVWLSVWRAGFDVR
jgi:hypothetical protein